MSIQSLARRPSVAAHAVQRLVAQWAPEPAVRNLAASAAERELRSDIAAERADQDYVTSRGLRHGSQRPLHARAERIASGLPG